MAATDDLRPEDLLRAPAGTQARAGRPANARIRKSQLRAEPLRESARAQGQRLQRRRIRTDDAFHISRELIPEGQTYEWKAAYIVNKPNTAAMVSYRENHWVPVLTKDHPQMMPAGTPGDAPIEKDGMMLMQRPHYLTVDARAEDYELATEQVTLKERALSQTPKGQFSREHPSARAVTGIARSYAPVDIPE